MNPALLSWLNDIILLVSYTIYVVLLIYVLIDYYYILNRFENEELDEKTIFKTEMCNTLVSKNNITTDFE